jgi:hypothetical protein
MYETGLIQKAATAGASDELAELTRQYIDSSISDIQEWASESSTGRVRYEEIKVASELEQHDMVMAIALFDQYAHVNRAAVQRYVEGDLDDLPYRIIRPKPILIPLLTTVAVQVAIMAAGAYADIAADARLQECLVSKRHRWLASINEYVAAAGWDVGGS